MESNQLGQKLIEMQDFEDYLSSLNIEEALLAAASSVKGKKVFTTSFSKEDQIISYMIVQKRIDITIITLDTGRHFEETYQLHQETEKWLDIKIQTFFPDSKKLQSLIEAQGPNGFYNSIEKRIACCKVRKSLPLEKALDDVSLWITGLRSSHSELRNSMKMWEQDHTWNLIKFNPIFYWNDKQVDDFINKNHIPINSLYHQGYTSIGCAPCTRPVNPGEHSRAGRWWWEESKKECGLHLNNSNEI